MNQLLDIATRLNSLQAQEKSQKQNYQHQVRQLMMQFSVSDPKELSSCISRSRAIHQQIDAFLGPAYSLMQQALSQLESGQSIPVGMLEEIQNACGAGESILSEGNSLFGSQAIDSTSDAVTPSQNQATSSDRQAFQLGDHFNSL